jgi:hypothetical protein
VMTIPNVLKQELLFTHHSCGLLSACAKRSILGIVDSRQLPLTL